ncbi:hypothetical protein K3759_14970 [Sulfitobacter sp. W027]|jgi:hypothetical protein|uniref:hypothetical protein n=2 Tax=Rhodobacterales TaxID=204455 RepID=UPI0021A4F04E|nr:hypothetical protein [Sulfitobacter sp. W027]UWR33223.1 hypothetical protein K3759_14970 [Sulfitobacter sp. W027]
MSDMTGLLAKRDRASKRQIAEGRLSKCAPVTVSSEKKAILWRYANSCQLKLNHSRSFALVSQQRHGFDKDGEQHNETVHLFDFWFHGLGVL